MSGFVSLPYKDMVRSEGLYDIEIHDKRGMLREYPCLHRPAYMSVSAHHLSTVFSFITSHTDRGPDCLELNIICR